MRVSAWFLIALFIAATAALLIRELGTSDADRAARQDAEEEVAEEADLWATAKECEQRLSRLLLELEDLQSRLRDVDVSYAEYVQTVMDVSSAYGLASIRDLERDCLLSFGNNAGNALDALSKAANVWDECTVDVDCDIDSIDPELQAHRRDAAAAIRQTEDGNGR
jgi:hypothetical protein